MRGTEETIRNSISGVLQTTLTGITTKFEDAFSEMTESYRGNLAYFEKAAIDYGRRLEKMETDAKDLKLLKIVGTLELLPHEAEKVPKEFAISMLNVAKNILIAKQDNTTTYLDEAKLVPQN